MIPSLDLLVLSLGKGGDERVATRISPIWRTWIGLGTGLATPEQCQAIWASAWFCGISSAAHVAVSLVGGEVGSWCNIGIADFRKGSVTSM